MSKSKGNHISVQLRRRKDGELLQALDIVDAKSLNSLILTINKWLKPMTGYRIDQASISLDSDDRVLIGLGSNDMTLSIKGVSCLV